MAEKKLTVRLGLDGKGFKRGLRRAEKDLKRFRASANQAFKRVGVAALATAGAATLIGARFEQEMAGVGAVAGASAEQMAKLEASARKMGSETAYSAGQAAEAQKALAAAGFKTTQIISALPAVLRYAGSQGAGLEESARAITSSLNAFGLAASESARMANTFAAATANSDLQIDNLGEAMSNVSATANTLGYGLEETVGALGLLANAGIKGGRAGTKLQAVMLKLNEVTSAQKGAIGKALQGWESGSEGMAGAIRRLEASGVSGQKVLEELGAKGGPVLAALLGKGSTALDAMRKSITGTNKSFEMYERMLDTTNGRFQILLSVLQEAAIRIFKVFKGPIDKALDGVTSAIQRNLGRIQEFAGKVITVLGLVGKTFAYLGVHAKEFANIAVYLGTVVTLTYAAATAQAIWNAVASANIWAIALKIIIAALGFVVLWVKRVVSETIGWQVVWIKTVDSFSKGFLRITTGLKSVVAMQKLGLRIWGALGKTIWEALKAGWDYIKRFADMVKDAFMGIGKMIVKPWKAKETWEEIKQSLSRGFGDINKTAGEKIDGIWSGLTDEYRAEMQKILLEHGVSLAEINRITQKNIREATAKAGGAAGGGLLSPEQEWVTALPNQPEASGSTGVVPGGGEAGTSLAERLDKSMVQPYRTAWDSIIDVEMSGKERRNAIWKSMVQGVWGALGDQLKAHLWTENAMTKGTQTSVFKRIALNAKERASDLKSAAVSIYKAVAGFFKAHASLPFIGAAIAGAAVAVMFGSLRRAKPRAMGGPVQAGQPYIVGEIGREAFIPNQSGQIISNANLKAALAGAQQQVTHYHTHLHADQVFADEYSFRSLDARLSAAKQGVDW